MILNVIFTGIGGQGVVTLAGLFRWAALAANFRVTGQDNRGGAQRLGHVAAVIRMSDEEDRPMGPDIPDGDCDLLISLEASEGLRFASALGKNSRVLYSKRLVVPTNQRRERRPYLSLAECRAHYQNLAGKALEVNAEELAQKRFNQTLFANYLLLGAGLEWCRLKALNQLILGQLEGAAREAVVFGNVFFRENEP